MSVLSYNDYDLDDYSPLHDRAWETDYEPDDEPCGCRTCHACHIAGLALTVAGVISAGLIVAFATLFLVNI